MKKGKLFTALLCSLCMVAGSFTCAVPVAADAMKVVTLGADLTEAQKNTMLKYFKVDSSQVHLMTITNQDERNYLGSYVPLEQIGTRTVSCAYVKPTQSGGIKVRTANLNWVTCNMIATTLSTSGVTNCEVVAACPFEVSGTGALAGITMAYEKASGQQLDQTKKELATEELVVTGDLAQQVGQNDATNIINQAKKQVIENNIQSAEEIYNVVVNIAEQNNMSVGSDQMDTIVSLLQEIAQQNYDYNEMKETLENVEAYLNGSSDMTEDDDMQQVDEPTDDDSIIEDLDESILGDDVIAGSTEDPSLEEETRTMDGDTWDYTEEPDDMQSIPGPEGDGFYEAEPSAEIDGSGDETGSDDLNTDALTDESKERFEKLQEFCKGEYEGDVVALENSMGPDFFSTVGLDTETGAKVSKRVQKEFLQVLSSGGAYTPDGTEKYVSMELNMVDRALQVFFGIDEYAPDEMIADISYEDRQALYNETMKFFEKLYDEGTASSTDAPAEEMPSGDTPTEDMTMEDLPVDETGLDDMSMDDWEEF